MSGLTRQEMKRDEVREWMEVAIDWIAENVRLIVGAAVGIAAVIGLVAAFMAVQASRAEAAQEELSRALAVFSAPIDAVSPDPDAEEPSFASDAERAEAAKAAFTDLADARGGDTGRIAQIYLGTLAANEGDFTAAREHWTAGIDGLTDSALSASVRMNLLSLDRQEGKHADIVASMEAELEAGNLPGDLVLYELARALEATGDDAQAQDRYQQLVDEHPGSQYAADARNRLTDAG